jgi:GH18 family chitinase
MIIKHTEKSALIYVALILCVILSNISAAQIIPNKDLRIYGYIVSWALNMNGLAGGSGAANYGNCCYTEIDYDACTDYIIFDAHFNSSGGLQTKTEWDGGLTWSVNPTMVQMRRPLNDYIHSKGKTVSMTMFVDGGGGSWTTLLSTAEGRDAMIKTIVDSLISRENQYDGVHFDPEPVTGEDTSNARIFFSQLRDSLNKYHQWVDTAKKPLMTVAIYGSQLAQFWGSVSQYFDAILHMSYNMFGSWQSITWYNAPVFETGYESALYNVQSIQGYTEFYTGAGIPREKLVMGCPFNYNAFKGGETTDGEGCYAPLLTMIKFPTWINTNEEMYYNCWNKYIDTATTTIHYDDIRKASWIGYNNLGSKDDMLILFQDTASIRANLEYISSQGLQGAMIWEICGGYLGIKVPDLSRHPGLVRDHLLQAVKNTRYNLIHSINPNNEEWTAKSENLPCNFVLYQNYPNPFNPCTIIGYQIPKSAHVILTIYDIVGHEIATLVNETKSAGSYKASWNAARFATGIYIAQLKAGVQMKTIKLCLIK